MYTEIKYLNLLSTQLEKFKKKDDHLWNFRCPVCGDSQRNKNKARGFVFRLKGNLVYKCHNCGISMSFDKLVEKLNPTLYKEYRLEKFVDSNKPRVDNHKVKRIVSTKPVFKTNILSSLTPIDKLNKSHPAREYLLNRKLPTEALYYTEKFQEWVNSVKPDTFSDTSKDEPRIIIPFISKEGSAFGFQGRSLHGSGLRYITILLDENQPKIFGLNTLDYGKTIYITEGPFDSMLLENSVAMAGADVSRGGILGDNVVYIYDNEPRNTEITKRLLSKIKSGQQVVIWPNNITQKDINDMHLAGVDVRKVVMDNVYSGLTAQVKFDNWKK
jgi:predicted RNA-binding Zn-ribbon protein involved in translation (DUF1610 family)